MASAADPIRVHLHSDSPFFSGSENMLVTLFGDERLRERVAFTFSYRADPVYEAGFRSRIAQPPPSAALPLPSVPATAARVPSALRPLAKAAMYVSGTKYLYVARDRRLLREHFAALRPDIVHINSGGWPGAYSCPAAALAAADAGVPATLFVANNIAQDYSSPHRWFDRGLDRAAAASVTRFVTGSTYAAGALGRVLALPPGRVETLPNGVRPRPVKATRAEVLSDLGVDPSAPVVTVVANLEVRKGQQHLLRAAVLPALADTGCTLIIEGEGPDESGLRGLARDLAIAERVRFAGRVADVWSLIAASDVIVLPSVANEDFPNIVLEAMSLGRPVVASRIAGTPEQIVDGETGLLVEPGDEAGLAAAVGRLVTDEGLRRRMGDAGRERFASCFTAERAAAAYGDLYRRLLAGAPARA
ncbi:MAG: glycosyltransferase family 4 protein [Coriobacteriia bacterium]|nr:glycosyltransferase family 4 protein [Coriobacteriia bacterium]